MVFNCMSDGRCLTDWKPICDTNNLLKAQVGINNNNDFRSYLQENATKLIKKNMSGNFCYTDDPNNKNNCSYCCSCMKQSSDPN